MKLLMKIVKSSLNEIDVFGTRQETRAIVGGADQFIKRYSNIKVNVFDNNGKAIKHNGEK